MSQTTTTSLHHFFLKYRDVIRLISVAIVIVIVGFAFRYIHSLLSQHTYAEIRGFAIAIPRAALLRALLFTVLSYLLLSTYDILGVRYIKKKIPIRRAMFAAYIAYAFNNSIGLASIGGSTARLRLYGKWGLRASEVLTLIGFCSLTFWLGFLVLAGTLLLSVPPDLPGTYGVSQNISRVIGAFLLLLFFVYMVFVSMRKKPIRLLGKTFEVPHVPTTLFQIAIASLDWTLAAGVLFSLLPDHHGMAFIPFLSIFVSAQVIALISHVPGGIGILEALVLYFLSNTGTNASGVIAALVIFRALYYLLPLLIASVMLIGWEIRGQLRKEGFGYVTKGVMVNAFTPTASAIVVFFCGAILLTSAALPADRPRLSLFLQYIPYFVLEAAHLLAALTGMLLLVLTTALQRRSHQGWILSLVALGLGVVFSLAKGLEYEVSVGLFVAFLLLKWAAPAFERGTPVMGEAPSAGWVAATLSAIAGFIWMTFFIHHRREEIQDFIWHFTPHGDAARSVRAIFIVSIVFALFLFVRRFVFSKQGLEKLKETHETPAVLMFTLHHDTLCGFESEVGLSRNKEDALLSFREFADANQKNCAVYGVETFMVPEYTDAGFTCIHIGDGFSYSLNVTSRGEASQKSGYSIEKVSETEIIETLKAHPLVSLWTLSRNFASSSHGDYFCYRETHVQSPALFFEVDLQLNIARLLFVSPTQSTQGAAAHPFVADHAFITMGLDAIQRWLLDHQIRTLEVEILTSEDGFVAEWFMAKNALSDRRYLAYAPPWAGASILKTINQVKKGVAESELKLTAFYSQWSEIDRLEIKQQTQNEMSVVNRIDPHSL